MRITVLGALGPGQLADSLTYGLRTLGHEVSAVSDKPLIPAARLGRLLARRRPQLLRWSGQRQQLELGRAVIATRPALVLAVKSPYLQAEIIDRIRAGTAAHMFNWYPDNPFVNYGQGAPLSALRHYDRIIVFSPSLAERVKKTLKVDAQYIPFGFDPRYYFPAPQPRDVKTDVAFVGQCRRERAALVSTLIAAGFAVRVAGPGWDAAAEPVRAAWRPGPTWGVDAARLYHEARVGLNDLHRKSNAHSHNMRTWEIPATGTPMATTDSPHQRELLRDIPGVSFYTGQRDLPTVVENLIVSAAQRGLPVDLSAHTYERRCRALVATL